MSVKPKPLYRNRIKALEFIRAGDLVANEANPREHPPAQISALKASMEEYGIVDAVLAFVNEEGKRELYDGHCRQGVDDDTILPVLIADLDRAEGEGVMAVLDPLAELARVNQDKLRALLVHRKPENETLASFFEDLRDKYAPEQIILPNQGSEAFYRHNPMQDRFEKAKAQLEAEQAQIATEDALVAAGEPLPERAQIEKISTRIIQWILTSEEFNEVTAGMREVSRRQGLETVSEVLLYLLRFYLYTEFGSQDLPLVVKELEAKPEPEEVA